MVNTFVFMGRPGAGKGVQSALLSQKIGLPVFSTGDKVRAVSKADHALGKKIRSVQEAGGLTPHWFAAFLFQEALFNEGSKGMIFEGKVIDIDGEPSPEEVSAAILKEIGYAPL